MHKIIFYPVRNGDTSQIVLENGKRILFDFRHLKKTEEGEGPEINLKNRLKDELKKADKKSFDVVALTHGDKDHIENSTEFFELRYAKQYQGEGRIKMMNFGCQHPFLETRQRGAELRIYNLEARGSIQTEGRQRNPGFF